jgi:hypothetical protein
MKRILFTTILAVTALFGVALNNGNAQTLEAQWLFNNSPDDETGNHDATLLGGATYTTTNQIEGSHCVSVNGTDRYVDCGIIDVGSQFTVTGWYLKTGTYPRTLFANNYISTQSGFHAMVDCTTGEFLFYTSDGSTYQTAVSTPGLHRSGEWVHFAFVVDRPAGSCQIYVDGNNVTLNNAIFTNFETNATILLGQKPYGYHPLKGYLDDVRIYSGLLSSAQVNNVYNFQPIGTQYTLITSVSPSGTGSVNPSGGSYNSGQVVQ